MSNNQSVGVNKLLLVSTILLILFGVAVVYTASAPAAIKKNGDPEFYLKAHCSKVLIAFVAMFVASRVDYSIWKKAARPVFIVGCALTLAAVLFGPTINGANRWIWGIQPSEILKFGFILMVATKLSDAGTEIKSLKCSIIQPGIPFLIAAILLALQPNFSMVGMFGGIFTIMLLVAGANFKHMLKSYGIAAGAGTVVVMLKELVKAISGSKDKPIYQHVKDRFDAFFSSGDPAMQTELVKKKMYQTQQSLEALGNGGILGTGVGNSAHKLGYLPEAHKDVVYSVVGEEFGVVGTLAVLAAFSILFYLIIYIDGIE